MRSVRFAVCVFKSTAAVKMCPHGGHTLTFHPIGVKYITHAAGVDITAA